MQDAEDACQATFLVLANRAKDGRWQESVANWLYTTARNVAYNARVAAERRAKREAETAVPESVEPVDRMSGRELLAALDAALDGLSPRYREPLVLCYLEGLTRDEAATRLGVPLATLHTRIDRARKRLHEVLTKAGCALGAGLLALAVSSPAGASPPRLVASILTAASGRAPAAVGELARGVAMNGSFHKAVFALATVVVAALGVGVGAARNERLRVSRRTNRRPPERLSHRTRRRTPRRQKPRSPVGFSTRTASRCPGRSCSRPRSKRCRGWALSGTAVLRWPSTRRRQPSGSGKWVPSGADGKFSVKVSASGAAVSLIARAEGVGQAFATIPAGRLGTEVELRTVKDHAIRGRGVDPQGKPVAGATVGVSKLDSSTTTGSTASWPPHLRCGFRAGPE